jgi:hypothetical protein
MGRLYYFIVGELRWTGETKRDFPSLPGRGFEEFYAEGNSTEAAPVKGIETFPGTLSDCAEF